jgi:hypothetical protein
MRAKGIGAMDSEIVETEDILRFDVTDEALERAAVVGEAKIATIGVCTHWYAWPFVPPKL